MKDTYRDQKDAYSNLNPTYNNDMLNTKAGECKYEREDKRRRTDPLL